MKVTLKNTHTEKEFFEQWGDISRICYNTPEKKSYNVGKHCFKAGHYSGARGLFFHFEFEGIPRYVADQMARHSVGTYVNMRSQRYCNEGEFNWVVPQLIDNDQELFLDVDIVMDEVKKVYKHVVKALEEKGFSEEEAHENARCVLPMSVETTLAMGFNVESLVNFCNKRLCNRTQYETRKVAEEMVKLMNEKYPTIAKKLVPMCIRDGKCPESKPCNKPVKRINEYNGATIQKAFGRKE